MLMLVNPEPFKNPVIVPWDRDPVNSVDWYPDADSVNETAGSTYVPLAVRAMLLLPPLS